MCELRLHSLDSVCVCVRVRVCVCVCVCVCVALSCVALSCVVFSQAILGGTVRVQGLHGPMKVKVSLINSVCVLYAPLLDPGDATT